MPQASQRQFKRNVKRTSNILTSSENIGFMEENRAKKTKLEEDKIERKLLAMLKKEEKLELQMKKAQEQKERQLKKNLEQQKKQEKVLERIRKLEEKQKKT